MKDASVRKLRKSGLNRGKNNRRQMFGGGSQGGSSESGKRGG